MVIRLGASSSVDYERGPLADGVSAVAPRGVDVLLDLISDPVAFEANTALVREGGTAVSIRYAAAAADAPYSSRIDAVNFNLRDHPDGLRLLEELTDQIESGSVTVVIDEEVALDNAPGFLSSRALGGARGKAVIAV
jgi:NADPH:quinone reductase-like Zn-dependent oxidoreductase